MLKSKILISEIAEIAVKAGSEIMNIYNNEDFSKVVDFKSDKSPLTLADTKANTIITRELVKIFPDTHIISEEEKEIPYEERKNWNTFWLVDPLDGTKEFINRNGEFTVNIALIEYSVPILGVIYAPALDILYCGSVFDDAYKIEKGIKSSLHCSKRTHDLVAVGSRSHASPLETELLEKYPVSEFISVGSSLKFCMIAEGKADIYYRSNPTMEWDTAAGHAIVECSGGRIYNKNYKTFYYNKTSLTNSSFLCLGNRKNLIL